MPRLIHPLRVLVVDDVEESRHLLRSVLSMDGHGVDLAADPREASALLDARPYDLLITDLHLPGVSGLDLVGNLRRRGIRIPAIVTSGLLGEEALIVARSLGKVACLPKPYSLARLRTLMHGLRGPEGDCVDH